MSAERYREGTLWARGSENQGLREGGEVTRCLGFDRARRNASEYGGMVEAGAAEADDLLAAVQELLVLCREWLEKSAGSLNFYAPRFPVRTRKTVSAQEEVAGAMSLTSAK